MRQLMRLLKALSCLIPLTVSASVPLLQGCGGGDNDGPCCRYCDVGKACGDTCIDRSDTCRTTGGCACNR
jgi:hypothetical protein